MLSVVDERLQQGRAPGGDSGNSEGGGKMNRLVKEEVVGDGWWSEPGRREKVGSLKRLGDLFLDDLYLALGDSAGTRLGSGGTR